MGRIWVVSLFTVCVFAFAGCSGVGKPDPLAPQKAMSALERGDLQKARMHAENAVHHMPDDPGAKGAMAAVHRALAAKAQTEGQLARASDAYLRAAEREPYRKQRAEDYEHAYECAKDAGRDHATSAQMLLQAVEATPDDVELRATVATIFDELGQANVAIEHYLWVWEADRTRIPIGMRLALLYRATGSESDAEAVFRRVIEADPDNAQAKLLLAEVYEESRRISLARSIYTDLVERYPDNPMVKLRYAAFLQRVGDDRAARKIADDAKDELPGVDKREMRKLRSRRKK